MIKLLNEYLSHCYDKNQIPSFGHFVFVHAREEKVTLNNESYPLVNCFNKLQEILDSEKEGVYDYYQQLFTIARIDIYKNSSSGPVISKELEKENQDPKVMIVQPNDLLHQALWNSPELKPHITEEIKEALALAQKRIYQGLADSEKKQLLVEL